jgi:plasmid maintenance system antidote protein VapI
MRLRDPQRLQGYMQVQDCSQSRLARRAQCSRQFVHMLLTGQRRSCNDDIAARIEDCLGVLPGTLFAPNVSPTTEQIREEVVA